jgi:hypothetical protein
MCQGITLKAFANSSPGLLQPRESFVPKNLNAESVGEAPRIRLRELLQSSPGVWVGIGSQGCGNPGLELANAFSVLQYWTTKYHAKT